MTLKAPPLTEAQFQQQITELAEIRGWEWFHVRAGRTRDSWRVPGSGSMAAGWPDLVLVHPSKRRLLFVEVKAAKGTTSSAQERVLDVLQQLAVGLCDEAISATIEVHVWRPVNWPIIERELAA